MIDHKYKFIQIHIPKTGGKSISRFFGYNSKKKVATHALPNNEIIQKYWKDYFTFTFVRSPYKRVISAYFYLKYLKIKELSVFEDISLIKDPCLIAFLENKSFKEFILSLDKEVLFNRHVFKPQLYWIKNFNYDYIGKIENIHQDLKNICKKLNIKFKKENVEHHNRSDHAFYKDYYDEEVKNKVYSLYKEDIEYFQYKF